VLIGKEHFYNGLKHGVGKSVGSRLLSIQNVTSEDEGDYVCEVMVHSGHKNHATYKLKAFSKCWKCFIIINYFLLKFILAAPDMTYLSLSVQGDVYEITRKAGTRQVQWIVQVSAYPKPSLLW